MVSSNDHEKDLNTENAKRTSNYLVELNPQKAICVTFIFMYHWFSEENSQIVRKTAQK